MKEKLRIICPIAYIHILTFDFHQRAAPPIFQRGAVAAAEQIRSRVAANAIRNEGKRSDTDEGLRDTRTGGAMRNMSVVNTYILSEGYDSFCRSGGKDRIKSSHKNCD